MSNWLENAIKLGYGGGNTPSPPENPVGVNVDKVTMAQAQNNPADYYKWLLPRHPPKWAYEEKPLMNDYKKQIRAAERDLESKLAAFNHHLVYVVGDLDGELYKIGMSSNIKTRIKDIKASIRKKTNRHRMGRGGHIYTHDYVDWRLLTLHHYWEVDASIQQTLESTIHYHLSDHRMFGEWFQTDLDTIIQTGNNILEKALND